MWRTTDPSKGAIADSSCRGWNQQKTSTAGLDRNLRQVRDEVRTHLAFRLVPIYDRPAGPRSLHLFLQFHTRLSPFRLINLTASSLALQSVVEQGTLLPLWHAGIIITQVSPACARPQRLPASSPRPTERRTVWQLQVLDQIFFLPSAKILCDLFISSLSHRSITTNPPLPYHPLPVSVTTGHIRSQKIPRLNLAARFLDTLLPPTSLLFSSSTNTPSRAALLSSILHSIHRRIGKRQPLTLPLDLPAASQPLSATNALSTPRPPRLFPP